MQSKKMFLCYFILLFFPIVFGGGSFRRPKDVYDKLGDVADFLLNEVKLLANKTKNEPNNMRFDRTRSGGNERSMNGLGLGLQGQQIPTQGSQPSQYNGRQNTQMHYHGAARSVPKTHASEIKMAAIVKSFTLLKNSKEVSAVLGKIGEAFNQIQISIQSETSAIPRHQLKLFNEYADQITAAYKLAIANHDLLQNKTQLKQIVDIGNGDFVVVYDSVHSMIIHTDAEGCKLYRSAIERITLPHQPTKQIATDATTLFLQATKSVQRFKNFVNKIGKLPGFTVKIPEHLKNMLRMIEKTVVKRRGLEIGNANMIFDVVRAMIVCETMAQVARVIDIIIANPDIIITRVKDRFFQEPSAGKF